MQSATINAQLVVIDQIRQRRARLSAKGSATRALIGPLTRRSAAFESLISPVSTSASPARPKIPSLTSLA